MTLFDWLVNGESKTSARFKDLKAQVDEEVVENAAYKKAVKGEQDIDLSVLK